VVRDALTAVTEQMSRSMDDHFMDAALYGTSAMEVIMSETADASPSLSSSSDWGGGTSVPQPELRSTGHESAISTLCREGSLIQLNETIDLLQAAIDQRSEDGNRDRGQESEQTGELHSGSDIPRQDARDERLHQDEPNGDSELRIRRDVHQLSPEVLVGEDDAGGGGVSDNSEERRDRPTPSEGGELRRETR
jgi:hypothetical protein